MTKTVIDDQIRIIVKPKDSADLLAFFKTVLSLLSGSFLPQPDKIIQPNGLNYAINGFLDPLVMTTLEQETGETKNAFELIYRDRENIQVISPSGNLYSLTEHQYLPDRFPSLLRALVISIAEEAAPAFVGCSLDKISRKIYFRNFQWEDRTSFSPNLEWLQYFGPEEFNRQGSEAIFNNPHIQAERLGEGILIQVGRNPADAYTEAGEQLLVEATKAMPPVRS